MAAKLSHETYTMNCPSCTHGKLASGLATVTLESDQTTVVYKGVPALVCDNCGEEFVDEAVTAELLKRAGDAAKGGVQVEVRSFAA